MILLLAPVGLSLAWFAFLALRRWPLVGAAALFLFTAVEWEIPFPSPLFGVGGTNVFPLDVLSALFLAVAAVQLPRLKANLGASRWAWYGVSVLLLVSLVRGIGAYGSGSAINEIRTFLYPYAAITWGMSLTWTRWRVRGLVGGLSLLQGWVLIGVALVHIALYGFGQADEEILIDGLLRNQRPLISAQAIVLLFCAVVVLTQARRASRPTLWRVSGVCFLVMVLIVQERTVWAAGVAVGAAVVLIGTFHQKRVFAASAAVIAVVVFIAQPYLTGAASFDALAQSSQNTGTYDGRVNSWLALIGQVQAQGPGAMLIGLPSGAGWGRFEGPGRWVEFYPHNWYVSIFLRTGLIGLAFMLAFMALVSWRLLTRRGLARANFLVLLGTAVYGWGYGWQAETAVVLGAALSGRLAEPEPEEQFDLLPQAVEPGRAPQPDSVSRRRSSST